MPSSPNYDYIFLGAGAAGLSLLTRMLDAGLLNNKKVLLIDKDSKTRNDRTWCFWEEGEGYFESIVHHRWEKLAFQSPHLVKDLDMQRYEYKMIRGIDFYQHCLQRLHASGTVEILQDKVQGTHSADGRLQHIQLEKDVINAEGAIVFSSLYPANKMKGPQLHLLQHFKGWIIRTPKAVFNPSRAVLMDFRISQDHGTSFVYVLPLSADRALIEYTEFTGNVLKDEEYEVALQDYITNFMGINNYSIEEKEFGVIPMTNQQLPFFKDGIYYIGSAGGQTKASTGYTFQFIQKQCAQIVSLLQKNEDLQQAGNRIKRFDFYDTVLLQLLISRRLEGRDIFTRLFERNSAASIFRFLDNETSFGEELRIISSLQIRPFLWSALQMLRPGRVHE